MGHRLNRRGFLQTVAAGAATAALPGAILAADAAGKRGGSFFFLQMADPQLFWGPTALWEKAIDHANRLKPAFVVVCGDLLNRDGNPAKLEPEKDRQRAKAYLDAAAKLDKDIPLYNVAGNHDVCNTPTPETLGWYRERFGKLWYSFTHGESLFLVLESDLIKAPAGAADAAKQQMQWLKTTLADAGKKKGQKKYRHKIVFMHHPMCLKAADEKSAYFNVPLDRRRELLKLFGDHGVGAVFSGHYHRNAYVKDGKIELVTSASTGKPLGKDPVGFRIVRVFADRIEHKYYGYADLPDRAALAASTSLRGET